MRVLRGVDRRDGGVDRLDDPDVVRIAGDLERQQHGVAVRRYRTLAILAVGAGDHGDAIDPFQSLTDVIDDRPERWIAGVQLCALDEYELVVVLRVGAGDDPVRLAGLADA